VDRLQIQAMIERYVEGRSGAEGVHTRWGKPLVAYADAADEMFLRLKEAVSPSHSLPTDLLPEARTVVAYFLPFDEAVVRSNIEGRNASAAWARAYVETNQLISDLNSHIADALRAVGYQVATAPPTHNFNPEKLISDWSHRHVAYIAGLGTFGLNNMLITEKGCCGRLGTFVTDLVIEPTKRPDIESCLYKYSGTCIKCVEHCVNDALREDGFDRFKCYEMCLNNDRLHVDIPGIKDVCGKCLVGVPCSTVNPTGRLRSR
jgi:epoxyqueuosine reductase QueG